MARNVCLDPRLVPGGGAVEMAVSQVLAETATSVKVVSLLSRTCTTPRPALLGDAPQALAYQRWVYSVALVLALCKTYRD